ncbi:hypothetical protein RWA06_02035 [Sinorhizobium meliloti]|uniref:hypothetical protein n=1 Tax=Rhizobium meliloti TaxID=382 RepID=UPI00299DA340|nr:hypothetical protein [Sinorhizobium meliloti]
MTDNDFLDGLLTPEEIARRITASSGVHMTARTVWEKARRIGVAKKIGRSMLISIEDVPALLREEKPKRSAYLYDPISAPTIVHRPGDALAALKRARKKRQKARLEKAK